MHGDDSLSGETFVALAALAALCGWLIVRALRYGRMEFGRRGAIDRLRQPLLFWGLIGVYAALPPIYLVYILTNR